VADANDASGSDAALDSPFRRRWTWWTGVRVTALGFLIGLVLRLLYATFRVRWEEEGDFVNRRARGERFIFAAWHDGLMLLPLVMLHVPTPWRPRVLISWHRDAEVGAQAARRFGVHFIRGSSTRGGIGAVRALIASYRAGEDVVLVPDGPRGPRHEAKVGVVQLANATGARIVPIALAAAPCRRLGSWDRMLVPLPFARVAIRLGAPIDVSVRDAGSLGRLQAAMDATVSAATAMVGGTA
jgi:lysophospholipid acyltransferase (LPLAT)-like uncharacterized protein